jgi:DNA repair protein RecO (recombination protein O)
MIINTSAIVLNTVDFSESSKIATLFTKEHGKIGVMGKGAKRPKSKFRGFLETGNLLNVVYYHKDSRSVQILSEASYHHKTMNLRFNFEKMAVMMSSLELITQLLHDEEINHPVFNFTNNFLIWLNDTKVDPANIFPYIQIRLTELMGIGLQLDLDEASTSGMYLNLESGLVSPQSTTSYSYRLTKNQYKYIRQTLQTHHSKIFSIGFQNEELKELVIYLDRYLNYHFEGLRDRKSDAVFDQLFIS